MSVVTIWFGNVMPSSAMTRCGSQVADPADGEHQHNHEDGAAPVGAHGGRGLNDEQKEFIVILNGQGYRKPKELTREWDRRKRTRTPILNEVGGLSVRECAALKWMGYQCASAQQRKNRELTGRNGPKNCSTKVRRCTWSARARGRVLVDLCCRSCSCQ